MELEYITIIIGALIMFVSGMKVGVLIERYVNDKRL